MNWNFGLIVAVFAVALAFVGIGYAIAASTGQQHMTTTGGQDIMGGMMHGMMDHDPMAHMQEMPQMMSEHMKLCEQMMQMMRQHMQMGSDQ